MEENRKMKSKKNKRCRSKNKRSVPQKRTQSFAAQLKKIKKGLKKVK